MENSATDASSLGPQRRPVNSTSSSPGAAPSNDDRILRRGDLARILGRKDKKLRDHHQGDLGRVIRSIPVGECGKMFDDKDDYDPHPFVYDIELVLGGKLMAVLRSELQYTTACEEGMTGESRQRRQRKPKEELLDSIAASATAVARQTKNEKGAAKKSKKATTGKSVSAQGGKKRGSSSGGNIQGKSKKQRGSSSSSAPDPVILPSIPNNGLDMFERHRREFERCLVRLEKADAYGYFIGTEIPPEHDECYDTAATSSSTVCNNETLITVGPQQSHSPVSISLNCLHVSHPPTLSAQSSGGTEASSIVTTDSAIETSKHNNNNNNTDLSSPAAPDGPPFNFTVLRKRLDHGRYILDRERYETAERIRLMTPYYKSIGKKIPSSKKRKLPVHHKKGIDWDLFRNDVIGMCDATLQRNPDMVGYGGAGTVKTAANKMKDLMEQIYDKIAKKQSMEMEISNDTYRYTAAINSSQNTEAAMQGKRWRREAFPERKYEKLRNDVVCAGLSELDERIATYELRTSLKDSFVGLAYTYDDTGQSEGWMKAMLNEANDSNEQQRAAKALSSDEGVIKAQVAATMEILLMGVQDRVMTETGVLEQPELRSANWEVEMETVSEHCTGRISKNNGVAEIVEQPVWGMDCYTRRNISICLQTEFDVDTVHSFIEKWLLPAINACPVDLAYNLSNAALILEGLPLDTSSSLEQDNSTTTEEWGSTLLGRALVKKIEESSPPWLRAAAHVLRRAITSLGQDFFRVHPKGHGSIVLCPKIEPNRLVTFYRGEVYPSWRWGEKMDAISAIQQKKGLKPRLPDFYNMALERPQTDPRGYGLLFVDASRKSGYGSMLSHSCNPSCEVKVVALNGELTLAMTTLREMTIGEEVTFDYNASTDSLHEYEAAVCLCGNVNCRGSFLHFAMADCYQQVLNRNSPIAVLLSQLIKGCTKQVMAEDDEKILKRHGFQSAVFGAVSVNRRKANTTDSSNASLDSMDFVPIWLRTFVADTLRYIEYERRALPIALLCNEITKGSEKEKKKESDEHEAAKNISATKKAPSNKKSAESTTKSPDEKPIKGHKPEPSFFFFSKRRREHFLSMLVLTDANSHLTGLALESELKKFASAEWKTLSPEEKENWKTQAHDEWKRNGGEEKARLEAERISRLERAKKDDVKTPEVKVETTAKSRVECQETSRAADGISFQAADAEGVRAMEQRIQQITQSLSRVGRVLDRHREEKLRRQEGVNSIDEAKSPAALRSLAHSPLSIMPDEHVVAWMWNHEQGIVRTMLRMAKDEICVSPDLFMALQLTESKFSVLSQFGSPWKQVYEESNFPMSPFDGRKTLNDALLEFRTKLLEGMEKMGADIKSKRASARENLKRRSQQAKRVAKITTPCDHIKVRSAVKFVLAEMVDEVVQRVNSLQDCDGHSKPSQEESDITEPWLLNFNKRFKLEKAADLLLLYTRTSTFFHLVPYEPLKSSPIEVYARELGNEVPRSVVDHDQEIVTSGRLCPDPKDGSCDRAFESVTSDDASESSNRFVEEDGGTKKSSRAKVTGFCDPEDIISEVVVGYQGDYVLSQLLQWYNAGIEQKTGLPDMLGCCMLPSMVGCWTIDNTKVTNSSTEKSTSYRLRTRPRLVEWLKDPFKRGSPWPDELRRHFVDRDEDTFLDNASLSWLPIGSPILDLLVTGDDFNVMDILGHLGSDSTNADENNEGLMSTVDHGRPAQAVSNWVQCENPSCQKWRKIPWHVDIDMLSEKFVCLDNVWNKGSASCDAPEDDWDADNDACVEADGSVKPREVERTRLGETEGKSVSADTHSCKLANFHIRARFDVLREDKKKWRAATVVDLDFVGRSKRVKFHFPRTELKCDIWLDADSKRIAPLYTHTNRPQPRQRLPSGPKDEQSEKAKLKLKQKAVSYNASFDSSFALATSENGSEVLDDEHYYEELGVGAVKDYEEIGDADTGESEEEEMELVDDSEDDGLDDDIEDDESEGSSDKDDEKVVESAKDLAVSTVTDHSAPDGSPKRERDFHMDSTHVDSETSQGFSQTSPTEHKSIYGDGAITIPKKKRFLAPAVQPADPDQSRIPKKKKNQNPAPETILGALSRQSKTSDSHSPSSLSKRSAVRNSSYRGTALPGAGVSRQVFQSAVDPVRKLELHREELGREQMKPHGELAPESPSYRDEQSRKRAIDRRKLNRDAINDRHVMNECQYDRYATSMNSRQTDPELQRHESEFCSPRRISLSDHRREENFARGSERNRGIIHDVTVPSHFDGYRSEDYQRKRLDYDRPHDQRGGPVERFSYDDSRLDVRYYDREPPGVDSSPYKRARDYDSRPNDYKSGERYSREENESFRPSSSNGINGERYRRDERYLNESPRHTTNHSPSCRSGAGDVRGNARFESQEPDRRGYVVEEGRSYTKRGYDIEPTTTSPKKRGYPVEEKKTNPGTSGYPVEQNSSPNKRTKEVGYSHRRDSHLDGRMYSDLRADDRYRSDNGVMRRRENDSKYEDRNYPRTDDGYANHSNDVRHRDEYSRRDHDDRDRRIGHDRLRDDYRYESPRSSTPRRSDHQGRDEYFYRAQEHARRRDRYYNDDGYDGGYRR